MEPREQLRSKVVFLLLAVCALRCGPPEPLNWFEFNPSDFSTHNNVTFLKGKVFTGVVYELSDSHDTMSVTPIVRGLKHGISKTWYASGIPKTVRLFESGKMEGEHKGWYENGQLKFVYHFHNDVFEGNVKEWAANGQLYRDFNYQAGHEKGFQKMWEADGRLKANYEVRNGRKYGLSGSKNCQSSKL